jgi:hypothetical protein
MSRSDTGIPDSEFSFPDQKDGKASGEKHFDPTE